MEQKEEGRQAKVIQKKKKSSRNMKSGYAGLFSCWKETRKICEPLTLFANFFTSVSCLAYSSTLKMEVTYSFETSVDFQRIARRYIQEDKTLQG
jgi:hypothetical protein